jgi:hypothetical protein
MQREARKKPRREHARYASRRLGTCCCRYAATTWGVCCRYAAASSGLDEATIQAAIDSLTRALATAADDAIPGLVDERRVLRNELRELREGASLTFPESTPVPCSPPNRRKSSRR